MQNLEMGEFLESICKDRDLSEVILKISKENSSNPKKLIDILCKKNNLDEQKEIDNYLDNYNLVYKKYLQNEYFLACEEKYRNLIMLEALYNTITDILEEINDLY